MSLEAKPLLWPHMIYVSFQDERIWDAARKGSVDLVGN